MKNVAGTPCLDSVARIEATPVLLAPASKVSATIFLVVGIRSRSLPSSDEEMAHAVVGAGVAVVGRGAVVDVRGWVIVAVGVGRVVTAGVVAVGPVGREVGTDVDGVGEVPVGTRVDWLLVDAGGGAPLEHPTTVTAPSKPTSTSAGPPLRPLRPVMTPPPSMRHLNGTRG
jgi:hypothetical protein